MALPFGSFFGLIRVYAGAVLALLVGISLAEAQSRQVLIVHSYGRSFLPWSEYATAIRSELEQRTNWPLFIQDHPLFTAVSDDENPEAAFAEYLRALYKRQAPDLILTIGAPAASFVQRHRTSIFPTAPAVFAAVDQRFVEKNVLTDYDTAVPVSIELLPLFQNILQLLPATKLIALMMGNSPPERLWLNEIQKELKVLEGRVMVSYYNDRSFDDMLKIAATLPTDSAIFWNQLRVDGAGTVYEGWGPLQRMYAAANAPIFSYDEVFFNGETVGGPMLSMTEVARKTASVTVRLLAGEKAANFAIEPIGLAPPRYDWRQLQRWHISESRLPSASEVLFREPSEWQKYRMEISAVAAAMLLQAGLIFWLILEHRRRHAAEITTREAMSELTQMDRIAGAGQLSASIAHEVNQPLAAIAANAGAAMRWLKAKSPNIDEAQAALTRISSDSQRAGDIVANLRGLFKKDTQKKESVELNKVILSVLELVNIELKKYHIEVRTQLDDGLPAVTGSKVQLQQLVLNLVMNAKDAMQSVPSQRELLIKSERSEPDRVQVSIEDSGPGISPLDLEKLFQPMFTTKSHGMGMGLSICRSIVEAHHGRIWGATGRETGAVFRISLPAKESTAGQPS